ncbi:MAG: PQQ-dependent sugar dehydrogenase [Gemmatimonadales bacterium]
MTSFLHDSTLFGALALGSILACGSDSTAPSLPDGMVGVRLEAVATGVGYALYVTAAPGDSSRIFIVDKGGTIRIVKDGTLLPAPFLDITSLVSTGGEQGLLGLAFDPGYATNGRFVVHYTDTGGNTRVSTFARSGADPDLADPASEQVVLTAEQSFENHNGGELLFGPDGLLYLGLGDGGSGGDPDGRGQDLTDLLGSILRLDLRTTIPYTIPADNPFAGTPAARPEIWSYGLRNPWRFSFDRATGDLYIGDVGQNQWEEVDVSPAAEGGGRGVNFGWNIMEGLHCFASATCEQSGLALPVLEYSHDDGCSVTGGYVYRGAAIPALQGFYFYADYCGGWVRSFRYQGGQATEPFNWPSLAPGGSVTSFGEDAAGELYVTSADGGVFRIVPT